LRSTASTWVRGWVHQIIARKAVSIQLNSGLQFFLFRNKTPLNDHEDLKIDCQQMSRQKCHCDLVINCLTCTHWARRRRREWSRLIGAKHCLIEVKRSKKLEAFLSAKLSKEMLRKRERGWLDLKTTLLMLNKMTKN
jgi:hypothetical protein